MVLFSKGKKYSITLFMASFQARAATKLKAANNKSDVFSLISLLISSLSFLMRSFIFFMPFYYYLLLWNNSYGLNEKIYLALGVISSSKITFPLPKAAIRCNEAGKIVSVLRKIIVAPDVTAKAAKRSSSGNKYLVESMETPPPTAISFSTCDESIIFLLIIIYPGDDKKRSWNFITTNTNLLGRN
jgi:hypothetical protein